MLHNGSLKIKSKHIYIMSLLESKINSIVAIALDTALNSARLDYVNETFYSKSDAVSALNAKQQNIILAPATITLGQSADYTYLVDTNSYSYPLFSSQDIVWRKKDNNISLIISEDFKNAYLSTAAAATLYARADEISTFETTVSMLNKVYQTKVDMDSYITSGSLTAYQPIADMTTYITSGSLTEYQTVANMSSYITSSQLIDKVTTATLSSTLDLYPTKDLVSDIFQDRAGMVDYQTVANMSSYITGGSIANTLTSYLTSSGASSLYQPLGSYVTAGSSLLIDIDNYLDSNNTN
jgi:hypothetical protein